jgi:hypothetical protein
MLTHRPDPFMLAHQANPSCSPTARPLHAPAERTLMITCS